MSQALDKIPVDPTKTNKKYSEIDPIAEKSNELILGLVGYAGSGCTKISKSIQVALVDLGYDVAPIKFSTIIEDHSDLSEKPKAKTGLAEGTSKLKRAVFFQNMGDKIREKHDFALCAYAIEEIQNARGDSEIGTKNKAFILDSLKHESEVLLLREVYGSSFKLLAVHCDTDRRFSRLYGPADSQSKFAGASEIDVRAFMDRDEKDSENKWGQQVREVFHLADYFVDDNTDEDIPLEKNDELKRFFEILLGQGFHRPEVKETAMYMAVSASLRSSCLSRQVGAAVIDPNGNLISTGSNDVPKFGGGTYLEANIPDNRCASWKWTDGDLEFTGCHNTRHKIELVTEITTYIKKELSNHLPKFLETSCEMDSEKAEETTKKFLEKNLNTLKFPKLNDLIEFSRSIHAEMDAIFSALRQGKSTVKGTLYCTTFPCHNCARHIVAAGIIRVYYIEPYVKSLAISLHSDSITTSATGENDSQSRLEVLPFTGVGPRMYEEHFLKRTDLKNESGSFIKPLSNSVIGGTRLQALKFVEDKAIALIKEWDK